MTRWLVTGAGGMLGRDLLEVLAGDQVTALDRAALDITDAGAVRAAVAGHDVVVNCAAWTDVDGAESAEEAATAVNGTAVAELAGACARSGARLLQVSTDYVLPGDSEHPYPEDAATGPLNAYGRSKLEGERAVARLLPGAGYIVRTAWLYGEHGRNFVSTMLSLAARQESVQVVDDQFGQPTWSYELALRLAELGRSATAPPGIYHGTAAGRASWYELARAAYELAGLDPERVRPTDSTAFRRPAVRPGSSVLGHARWAEAGLPPLPEWRESLAKALRRPAFQTPKAGG
ncbi:dTDP-4-dehydrorhamnose reductase [Saccharothrix sp. ST-888]|uniref:dTDP-4-dehydrorhamnose reductase n=1 Tax=Saccharothrix sp. ST-888 TaxID=1427391 RepID=UPI0005EC7A36|nr:dTDP-4-dehydrorhamnose reductase [Saccharothrix sp. ST-888]KJK56739.1 dTDP-4-dehydrorhamnose reductase [Saccharothrix sp. ST-888]